MKQYAEILRALAEGKQVQRRDAFDIGFHTTSVGEVFGLMINGIDPEALRVAAPTITINGIEVPEPMRVAPKKGTVFFLADPADSGVLSKAVEWEGDEFDTLWLRRGLCHTIQEAAEAHTRALILASGGTL